MPSLIAKLILCPVILILATFLLPYVNYSAILQPIAVGLAIGAFGYLLELLFLRRGTFWISNFLDLSAAFLLIYYSQFVFTGAFVTVFGALLTSLVIFAAEYSQHLFLLRSRRRRRIPRLNF